MCAPDCRDQDYRGSQVSVSQCGSLDGKQALVINAGPSGMLLNVFRENTRSLSIRNLSQEQHPAPHFRVRAVILTPYCPGASEHPLSTDYADGRLGGVMPTLQADGVCTQKWCHTVALCHDLLVTVSSLQFCRCFYF